MIRCTLCNRRLTRVYPSISELVGTIDPVNENRQAGTSTPAYAHIHTHTHTHTHTRSQHSRPLTPTHLTSIMYTYTVKDQCLFSISETFLLLGGVAVFKSSKISVWPIYLTFNKLPFKIRKKEQILCFLAYIMAWP